MNHDPQSYDFQWEDLGDLESARPNLGESVSLAVYRLMVFTFKDTLSAYSGRIRPRFRQESVHRSDRNPAGIPIRFRPPFRSIPASVM